MSDQYDSARKTDSSRSLANLKKNATKNDLGDSLRSVYEQTIGEDIPREMLDLLSKLD